MGWVRSPSGQILRLVKNNSSKMEGLRRTSGGLITYLRPNHAEADENNGGWRHHKTDGSVSLDHVSLRRRCRRLRLQQRRRLGSVRSARHLLNSWWTIGKTRIVSRRTKNDRNLPAFERTATVSALLASLTTAHVTYLWRHLDITSK